ncbi:hypothetical protein EJ110_NYTH28884 [Nymphaea thermarum]|nr:hypothetical protein EJ110_NYTH28884 [Nymphaea thermarum]
MRGEAAHDRRRAGGADDAAALRPHGTGCMLDAMDHAAHVHSHQLPHLLHAHGRNAAGGAFHACVVEHDVQLAVPSQRHIDRGLHVGLTRHVAVHVASSYLFSQGKAHVIEDVRDDDVGPIISKQLSSGCSYALSPPSYDGNSPLQSVIMQQIWRLVVKQKCTASLPPKTTLPKIENEKGLEAGNLQSEAVNPTKSCCFDANKFMNMQSVPAQTPEFLILVSFQSKSKLRGSLRGKAEVSTEKLESGTMKDLIRDVQYLARPAILDVFCKCSTDKFLALMLFHCMRTLAQR